MGLLAGIDIGGTKCVVCIGRSDGEKVEILKKRRFHTPSTPRETLDALLDALQELQAECGAPDAVGVACGGPLETGRGLILSPPNLPGWDSVDVLTPLRERFGVLAALENDANACALAEWRWGAGQGCRNLIFLTFSTGMGAGLILDGRLYAGTNGLAGEMGHIRMEPEGPVGYGKAGSFEGFCSGGGLVQLARARAEKKLREGRGGPLYCPTFKDLPAVTAEAVGRAARKGDALAQEVFGTVGMQLGRGLAILVDLLNPERIILGTIYGSQQSLLEPVVLRVLEKEALPLASSVCRIVPAGLKEDIGAWAGLAIALDTLSGHR